jgi:hypothetical protein
MRRPHYKTLARRWTPLLALAQALFLALADASAHAGDTVGFK